jgi:hypothetical protein
MLSTKYCNRKTSARKSIIYLLSKLGHCGESACADTPYVIDANNTDNYPLMNPVVIPEFQPFLLLPLLITMTLLAVAIHRKTRPHPKIGTAKQQDG